MTAVLPLPPYLRLWCLSRYGSPLRFPRRSIEADVLRRGLSRLPRGESPMRAGASSVEIHLPDDGLRRPDVWFHLPRRARVTLRGTLRQLMLTDLWNSLGDASLAGTGVTEAVEQWCASRGIPPQHREAVRQMFYRLRRSLTERGIVVLQKKCQHKRRK